MQIFGSVLLLLTAFQSAEPARAEESLRTYRELVQLIESQNVDSIEELLPLLPASLRGNYTLVYRSRSLQGASPKNPRAILFYPDASLILTFNGAKNQKRFSNLEILEFSGQDQQARLFEIDFAKKGKARFSAANPAVCLECHASYPRPLGDVKPIWPEYSTWHGAYGSSDDNVDKKEKDDYLEFVELSEQHPRYKWLIRDAQHSSVGPFYTKAATSVVGNGPVYEDKYQDGSATWFTRNIRYMPNIRLSKVLDLRNGLRIHRKLSRHPLFIKAPYSTLHAIQCDYGNADAYPAELLKLGAQSFGIHPNEFQIAFADDKTNYESGARTQFSALKVLSYQILKNLAENDPRLRNFLIPIYWESYYASFGLKTSLAQAGDSETLRYARQWSRTLDRLSPSFAKNYLDREDSPYGGAAGVPKDAVRPPSAEFCEYLFSRAVREAKNINRDELPLHRGDFLDFKTQPAEGDARASVERIRRTCAGCHDAESRHENIGPFIPFSDEENLRLFIRSHQIGSDNPMIDSIDSHTSQTRPSSFEGGMRMPLGRKSLYSSEQRAFIEYLRAL